MSVMLTILAVEKWQPPNQSIGAFFGLGFLMMLYGLHGLSQRKKRKQQSPGLIPRLLGYRDAPSSGSLSVALDVVIVILGAILFFGNAIVMFAPSIADFQKEAARNERYARQMAMVEDLAVKSIDNQIAAHPEWEKLFAEQPGLKERLYKNDIAAWKEVLSVTSEPKKPTSLPNAAKEEPRRPSPLKKSGSTPSSADDYAKLAEAAGSSNDVKKKEAIESLMRVSPSQVSSLETKKKIAKVFRQLSEDQDSSVRGDAIDGLVKWGGKYSGPILLKMLEKSPTPFETNRVIKAIGEIGYAEAAPALISRLADLNCQHAAGVALKELGAEVEDALIDGTRSKSNDICVAVIKLLGESGTTKSLPVLRDGASHADSLIRSASKEAIRKIESRQPEAKADEE
jgi:hypothetical protein